jgi:hypothetical protein
MIFPLGWKVHSFVKVFVIHRFSTTYGKELEVQQA